MNDGYLIVGLGNPGKKYKETRHNAGFLVIDRISDQSGCNLSKGRGVYEYGSTLIASNSVILAKPTVYMNNSGLAVRELIDYFKIKLSNLLIIFDDVDLPFGKIRLRGKGGAGGHNGVKSIIQHLQTNEFARLRIGICNDYAKADMTKFVLSPFSADERKNLHDILEKSSKIGKDFVINGLDQAMNKCNTDYS
ncbi:aminoacyl-tRNA hydrolase [candidate division KSB1 bacterium]|nr:aminoacyl-tRNA hydrolase [candidate division KSB1 bacterium]